ncbi:hypothetical protein ACIA6C_28005 [Streptomyces sp. NPDC051578]|uniref:hypothetical protein n=1 Tax=Streptomyces sp. NPDC051578 TaxID=3365662 RepID=UPI0037BD5C2C
MTQADNRTQLADSYTQLVAKLETHLRAVPGPDQHELARWQTLYAPEVEAAIKRRDSITPNGSGPAKVFPSSSQLRAWMTEAELIPRPDQA